jgi:hypothetical protein
VPCYHGRHVITHRTQQRFHNSVAPLTCLDLMTMSNRKMAQEHKTGESVVWFCFKSDKKCHL